MLKPISSSRSNHIIQTDQSFSHNTHQKLICDEIQRGQNRLFLSGFCHKVKDLFFYFYTGILELLSRFFSCCGFNTEAIQFRKDIRTLYKFYYLFVDRQIGNFKSFKKNWNEVFESFHPETRHLLLLEDVKSWAPPEITDIEKWAEDNYVKQNKLSRQFVLNLEKIRDGQGGSIDPFGYIPVYILNVIKKLELKIK